MTFGDALLALRSGKKVRRSGWNGRKRYIKLASNDQIIASVGTSGDQIDWLASKSDSLADDWYVIKE